jgi:hypothetical protein
MAAIKKRTRHRRTDRRHAARHHGRTKRWSAKVARESNALDLHKNVFTQSDPKRIAASLKRSAEHSRRRKADPYRSAMSMLTFYINRAGRNLPAPARRPRARQAKFRSQFGRA